MASLTDKALASPSTLQNDMFLLGEGIGAQFPSGSNPGCESDESGR